MRGAQTDARVVVGKLRCQVLRIVRGAAGRSARPRRRGRRCRGRPHSCSGNRDSWAPGRSASRNSSSACFGLAAAWRRAGRARCARPDRRGFPSVRDRAWSARRRDRRGACRRCRAPCCKWRHRDAAATSCWLAQPASTAASSTAAMATAARYRTTGHACTARPNTRLPSRTVVRSITRPASWPQAASMSSPRVRRTVASTPRRISSSRKRCTASGAERR